MFALLAAIVFAVGTFDGKIAGLNLLYLGLTFLAIHHIFDVSLPFGRRNP